MTPLSWNYCPFFPPPFLAQNCVPPYLHDSFSHYCSAIWLLPQPSLTRLCLCPSISQVKGHFLIPVLVSFFAMVGVVDCCLLWGILSSLVREQVFSCPVGSLSNVLTGLISCHSQLGPWRVVQCGSSSFVSVLLLFGLLFGLMSYHYFSKYGSFIILCTQPLQPCRHSVFWPCLLSSSFLKVPWPIWHRPFCVGVNLHSSSPLL